ncbi:hypothetical protein [Cohnella nanjingensis]|uniref:Uncharacterized protein n=1 Tax=Cohnella nanjingensis TaxID=1387779 RepID=A0A7X0RRT9_9BACL|nr:hypothetical protein [Cohnella nanjingensis]MBB6672524.1 hypothetical protein [Cohnella nanjingensis]
MVKWMSKLGLLSALAFLFSFNGLATAAISWNEGTLQAVVDPSGNFYAYAPTVIEDGGTEHIYTCHNSEDGIIRDSVYYTQRVNGSITQTKEVLRHGEPGSWDSQNVCDTAVVGGKFLYNGITYDYAMFYLGNNLPCSCNNQIGVAFSNDLSADSWTKYPGPIVTYPLDGVSWGVGQQSATSVDGNGRVLLFYTLKDSTNAVKLMRVDANLHDMSSYTISSPMQLSNNGLVGIDGSPNNLDNIDIVYDSSRDRFYAITEMQPYPTDNPSYISVAEQIVSIPAIHIWNGGGTWRYEGKIDAGLTGSKRNHNAGIARTIWGGLPSFTSIRALFTKSCAGAECTSIPEWTYDVWSVDGSLSNDPAVVVNDGTVGTGTNQFNYSGNWHAGTQISAYGEDEHWSSEPGAYYTMIFAGQGFQLYGSRGSFFGIAAISVDGGPETMVDLYSGSYYRKDNVLLYTSPTLPSGNHTLKVRVTGTANLDSDNVYVSADRIEVTP